MVYMCDGILLSLKKEGSYVTYYSEDDLWGPYIKRNNLVTKRHILHDFTVWGF